MAHQSRSLDRARDDNISNDCRLYSVAAVRCAGTCRRYRLKHGPLRIAKRRSHAIAPRCAADGEPCLARQHTRRNKLVAGEIDRTSLERFEYAQSACPHTTGDRSETRQMFDVIPCIEFALVLGGRRLPRHNETARLHAPTRRADPLAISAAELRLPH